MKENYLLTFLKGIMMGAADVIPGVSGGTIAFITGIYDRLISGIKDIGSFIVAIPKSLKNKKLISSFTALDFALFIPLFLGIAISFIVGSQIISGLMEKYPALIYSFFIGLILASAVLIFRKIKSHTFMDILLGVFGFALGVAISLLPISTKGGDPSLIFMFFLGMIAICAMILPGISGAYIVLMFGQLKFLYAAVGNITVMWPFVLVFGIGAIIGILLFSRLLHFLLENYHSKTLYALTGIMLGALIGPVRIAVKNINSTTIYASLALLVFGIAVVWLIDYLSKRSAKSAIKEKKKALAKKQ